MYKDNGFRFNFGTRYRSNGICILNEDDGKKVRVQRRGLYIYIYIYNPKGVVYKIYIYEYMYMGQYIF